MVLPVAVRVFVNVRVVKKHLAVLDPGERVADLSLPCPQCLDLRPMQDDAGLERLQYVIIPPPLGIGQNAACLHCMPDGPSRLKVRRRPTASGPGAPADAVRAEAARLGL